MAELDTQLEQLRSPVTGAPVQVNRSWVDERLQKLNDLLAKDPAGARREIQKHIDDLRIVPAPAVGDRVLEISGHVKVDGLLEGEEAMRPELVAGARFELWKRPLKFEFLLTY